MASIIVLVMVVTVTFGSLIYALGKRWKKAIDEDTVTSSQIQLSVIIMLLFAGTIAYRAIAWGKLEQTSALFIGLPTLLALIVVLTPKADSVTGMIIKGLTIALLMSGILLGEGFICIVMSAPLFYLVGVIIGFIADRSRKKNSNVLNGFIIFPLFLLSLEGVSPELSFQRAETVSQEQLLPFSRTEVLRQLAKRPDFDGVLPPYLRLGFPRPVRAEGTGLYPGALRKIRFAGGEGSPGDLTLVVEESTESRIIFKVVSDTSHIAHWLDWKRSVVELTELGPHQTRISWTVEYDRQLDPAWYFAPWERYAVSLAAEYLINQLATPRTSSWK